jgi:uncharacterized protein YyaL (SSP411 family)
MLYDNAPLLALYADAWRATGEPLFQRVATETAGWVLREMQAPEGGYYSSLDADSEHEEGRFYVWTPQEVRSLLSAEEWAVVEPYYGLDRPANFEGARWHLRVTRPLGTVARQLGKTPEQCAHLLDGARMTLLAQRDTRVRPGRDDKILTSWNALMIRGLARAGRLLARGDWIDSAQRAVDFLRTTLWRDGRLHATHRAGRTHLNAYLDDHAFLLDALLELLRAQFRTEDLAFARTLANAMLERFEDRAEGGFFFTSHDHEALIQRTKPGHDNATPAGNGIAALALTRLGHQLGEARYLPSAERALALFGPHLQSHPGACTTLVQALEEQLQAPTIVVLRGPQTRLGAWCEAVDAAYRPGVYALAIPNGTGVLPPTLAHPETDAVNAWICRGVNCLPPLADIERLPALLAADAPG